MPQDQPGCHGNGADHCCYWQGEVCPYLEENTVPGRRWACGLRRELGSWEAVHEDERYLNDVQPLWRGSGRIWEWLWQEGVRCGSWGFESGPGNEKGMGDRIKVKGNDEQWKKDFLQRCFDAWRDAQNGERVEWLCCFGNVPEEGS